MNRNLLAFCLALLVAGATYATLHYLYDAGFLKLDLTDVDDGHGHGPDHFGAEAESVARIRLPSKIRAASGLTGFIAYVLILVGLRFRKTRAHA